MKYIIDYGSSCAEMWTPSYEWKEAFFRLAGDCFGIRKSITKDPLLIDCSDEETPGGYERLEHNGDTIIWDEKGRKIKSEWDY